MQTAHSTQALTGNPMESFQGTLGLSRIRTPSLGWVGCICPDGWSDKCWRKVLVGVFSCTYSDYMDKPFHSQRCVLFVQSSPNSHFRAWPRIPTWILIWISLFSRVAEVENSSFVWPSCAPLWYWSASLSFFTADNLRLNQMVRL